jgi:hypothetical protein
LKFKLLQVEAATAKANRRWMFSVVAAILIFAALWVLFPRSKAPEKLLIAVPLTTYPGSERGVAFSPDGP